MIATQQGLSIALKTKTLHRARPGLEPEAPLLSESAETTKNISFCQKASGQSHYLKSSSVLCSQNLEERNGKEDKKVKSSRKKNTLHCFLRGIRVVWM